jgi:putative heme-binding domain-containing protein
VSSGIVAVGAMVIGCLVLVDFLEAVVFPSASFARGYEPFTVLTRDGQVFPGIITRETAEAIYVTANATTTARILRSDLKAIEQGTVSIMPEGLDQQLTRGELGDLMAFLVSLR